MRIRFYQLIILFFAGTVVATAGSFVFAQTMPTINELQQKISSGKDELAKHIAEKEALEKDLDKTVAQKKTLGTEIKTLDLTKKMLDTDIKITQTKVNATDLVIRQLGSEISYKEDEISARAAALKEALLAIYESDEQSLAEVALSNDSFSGLWNDLETLEQFTAGVNENIELIRTLKQELEDRNNKKKKEKGKLLGLKEELGDQKKITEGVKKQKAQLLAQASNLESKYQKDLRQKKALIAALEKEINDYESTLKFILDPTSIPPRGTKVFSSPLDDFIVTQHFGKTSGSSRLYASGLHNGTDLRARTPVRVMAMQNGVVAGTGDTDVTCPGASFGKWVLIRYNNGLASVYGHLSLIKVSTGDVVSTGDIVGYSGNTGYSMAPHLHVSVYASAGVKVESRPSKSCGGKIYTLPLAAFNAYLDPMDYL